MVTKDDVIKANEWHHVVATAVKGDDSAIYVDGEEVAREDNPGDAVSSSAFYIGDLRGGRKIAFEGKVDELAIFDAVLSDADIGILTRGGKAVSHLNKLATTWSRIKNQ